MSEHDRFLLTFDSARGVAVKVERVGKDGDLTEVDMAGLLGMLAQGPDAAAAAQPINININFYGGKGTPAVMAGGLPNPPLPPLGIRCSYPNCPSPKEEEQKA